MTTTRAHCDPAFDVIVAAFDALPLCEVRSPGGDRCPNHAHALADFHGCGRGLICKAHLRAFTRQVGTNQDAQCKRCGWVFGTIEDSFALVVL